MGVLEDIARQKAALKEADSWDSPQAAKIPSNVTGSPPPKPVANMAADAAQRAADNALKKMGQ